MTETESTQATKQVKSDKLKFDKRTIIAALFFILFIIIPVTLLMPRSGIIGISLQVFAGLIFLLAQFWEKILGSNQTKKLAEALYSKTFYSRVPLLAIPFIVPILLVVSFKFSSPDMPWIDALFSIIVITAIVCFVYLFVVVNVEKWVQRLVQWIRQKLGKSVDRASPNYLIPNSILLILSLLFSVLIFLKVPLPALYYGSSIPTIALFVLTMWVMMFLGCIFILSLLYFALFLLLKAGIALRRVHLNLSDADRALTQQLFWAFLLASWIWGGILIAVNMW